jgi:hypothetical protein
MKSRNGRLVIALALVSLSLAAAGCGTSSSPTNPGGPAMTQETADDFALQAQLALNQMGADVDGAVGGLGGGQGVQVARHLLRPTSAQWDTSYTRGGLTVEASANFYDAGNQVLPGYGPTAVKLLWSSRIYGTFESERDTATVGHAGALQITGIQPADTAGVINGSALDTLLSRFLSYDGTRSRYFYWTSSLAIANLVWPKTQPWPASGTLTFTVRADRLHSNDRGDVEAHLTATVVVTFNGTSHPDLVVDRIFHYVWEMDTGSIVRA